MLKKFMKDGKTFTPKQDLGEIQQWECGGDLFTVGKRNPSRDDVSSAYEELCDNDQRYGTEFRK
jgi:hypothetical protein